MNALQPEVRQALERLDLRATLILQGFLLDHCIKLLAKGDVEDKRPSRLLVPGR